MTDSYLPATGPQQRGDTLPPASADEPGTAVVVRDQASDLRRSGVQGGKHVADVPGLSVPDSRGGAPTWRFVIDGGGAAKDAAASLQPSAKHAAESVKATRPMLPATL
jgi:hypothetical protein